LPSFLTSSLPLTHQAVRDVVKAKEAAMEDGLPKGSYTIQQVDLASLASVSSLADSLLASGKKLDALVCNAAVYLPNQQTATYTADGYEMSFGVNHLAHHLLVRKLLPLLQKTKGARCIIVGSITGNSNTVGGGAVYPLADLGGLKGASLDWGRSLMMPLTLTH
jgi:protochlorophyllide reductase